MNANDSATKEHDEMRRAFQEFMLNGVGGKKKTTAAAATTPPPLPTTTPPSSSYFSTAAQQRKNQQQLQRRRSLYKRHQSALQGFNNVLVRDWLHVDDQLGRVVDSIVNLRHRIQLITSNTARLLEKQEERSSLLPQSPLSLSKKGTVYYSSWKNHGYRQGSSSMTTLEEHDDDDLQLALNHSLLMHENMMAKLRKPLLPLLHEAQETLGRRLQDFMVVVDECDDFDHDMDNDDPDMDDDDDDYDLERISRMQADLQACQELYRALAEEVYRKQDLIQVCILDTVHDNLLVSSSSNVDDDWTMTDHPPANSADWCSVQWSRQGKASALYKFQNLLNHIQQQQKQQQQDNDGEKEQEHVNNYRRT